MSNKELTNFPPAPPGSESFDSKKHYLEVLEQRNAEIARLQSEKAQLMRQLDSLSGANRSLVDVLMALVDRIAKRQS